MCRVKDLANINDNEQFNEWFETLQQEKLPFDEQFMNYYKQPFEQPFEQSFKQSFKQPFNKYKNLYE